jgi:hypothetical protein
VLLGREVVMVDDDLQRFVHAYDDTTTQVMTVT